ncbi:hypothetical protein KFL_002750090 [Klebsormidium nitens]|uniref:F-box domain-containing protein n=1 Tax=Klebsormidium nitens TaxID=105231 RepID=A0A1Y1I8B6_KLENI|nr:hypothetical protein KFL_002750090 [Klebsormidium nitens]|eukprot:GAQ86192.1 hypothetical protein KFL_002750090 [Klebsormidium nitens]
MARTSRGTALPSEVISNILGRLDAADVARGKMVCARWRAAGSRVKTLRFTEETFPEGMAPEQALTIMTNMIMQATELECLDMTYVSTAGLPDSLLTAWLLAIRPTLVTLRSTNIYSFEQTLAGMRHPTIARHVSAHVQRTALRHLVLCGAELPADVAPLPLLETLELSDVSATSAALRGFVAGCGRLARLTLADLDGLNCIELRSNSLRELSIGAEMNSVSFTVKLDCPNLRALALKSISLRSAHVARASALETLTLCDVSGGPITLGGVGDRLRAVVLRGVTWQHVGAAMGAAQGKDLRVLEVDDVAGADVWMEDDDTDSDSHVVSPRSPAPHRPVELDLLSDTEEAFDVETRRRIALPASAAGALPAAIASFQNLQTLRLGATIWNLCRQAGFRTSETRQPTNESAAKGAVTFPRLREFGVTGAPVGADIIRAIEAMVKMCPALRKLALCGELGREKAVSVALPLSRLPSSGSRTSIDSAAPACDDSTSGEVLDGSESSSPTFHQGALARFPAAADRFLDVTPSGACASGDVCASERDVTAFSTKFALQAMALQRKYPKLVVDVLFRNSDLQTADQ